MNQWSPLVSFKYTTGLVGPPSGRTNKLQESIFSKRNDLKCLWYGTKRTIDITASGMLEMLILTVVSLENHWILLGLFDFG